MIYCIGEALIDMIPDKPGISLRYVNNFSKQAGGAPANVAATVGKLGGKSAFITKLGSDGFGKFIVDVLKKNKVDTSKVYFTDEHFTGIVFVTINKDGGTDFCGMRQDSADMYLEETEIKEDWFTKDDILHFCSVSLLEAPVKYAHIKAIETIIEKGGRVSFDINLRPKLWSRFEDCLFTMWKFMRYPDYLKLSDEEVKMILNTTDYRMAINKFFEKGERLKFIILTKGDKGANIYFRSGNNYHIQAHSIQAVDTTGAGDCFMGSTLYQMDKIKGEPTEEQMKEIMEFANMASAIQVSRLGAIESLPTMQEITEHLKG